jgi:hypothetical protein
MAKTTTPHPVPDSLSPFVTILLHRGVDFRALVAGTSGAAIKQVQKLCKLSGLTAQNTQALLMVGLFLFCAKAAKLHRRGAKKRSKGEKLKSFKQFAYERFGISEAYAHRLPAVAVSWTEIADHPVQPESIDSVRPLGRLIEPGQKRHAWDTAVAKAGNNPPTKATVESVVSAILGEQSKAPKLSAAELLARESLELLNKGDVEGTRSRLLKALGEGRTAAPKAKPIAAKVADADRVLRGPVPPITSGVTIEPTMLPAAGNGVIYQGEGFTLHRMGKAYFVRADESFHDALAKIQFYRTGNPGEWSRKFERKMMAPRTMTAIVRTALSQLNFKLSC